MGIVMTQEEKDLVLKDLCARTPYKTKINVDDIGLFSPTLKYIDGITCHFYECAWTKFIDEIKPYLRPMSSMTEEEKFELGRILSIEYEDYLLVVEVPDIIDFYNQNHLDYRGLIEKGLALEAPEDMYKTE